MRDFLAYCVTYKGRRAASLLAGHRVFDVALNDYSGEGSDESNSEYLFAEPGHKWPCISKLLPKFRDGYKAFCFLDDDVEIDVTALNWLFTVGMAQGLKLWQPALTWDSVGYWKFLYQRRDSGAPRKVPLVEVMMPFFSAETLDLCSPYFAEFESGHALDQMWAKVLGGHGLYVMDSVTAGHHRPMTSPKWIMSNGMTAHEDAMRLRRKYNLKFPSNDD